LYLEILKVAKSGELGKLDKNILRELQREGRITFAELARRVGLSTSPCLERV
jgi:Lrp/AsnC family leucine-responsive transcriptional regulator